MTMRRMLLMVGLLLACDTENDAPEDPRREWMECIDLCAAAAGDEEGLECLACRDAAERFADYANEHGSSITFIECGRWRSHLAELLADEEPSRRSVRLVVDSRASCLRGL